MTEVSTPVTLRIQFLCTVAINSMVFRTLRSKAPASTSRAKESKSTSKPLPPKQVKMKYLHLFLASGIPSEILD
jgi:hypothetical protein